jgi:hypothetical protein
LYGLGSFLAAQIVADVKFVGVLRKASDWATFAASGPGSRRGLNILKGAEPDAPWNEMEWRLSLGRLMEVAGPRFAGAFGEPLSAQDMQNCLCEFHKYYKAFTGTGRPKQYYKIKENA